MRLRSTVLKTVGLAFALGLIAPVASATTSTPTGTKSLAEVLLADGDTFDSNWQDYDIVTQAALAVLENKPGSPVSVLLDGNTAVTAFIPNDQAFRALVRSLTGSAGTEEQVFGTVASLGIDTVETVLLYHVVPGATITSKQAAKADEAKLTTAQGGTIRVNVVERTIPLIRLGDKDPDALNPWVNPLAFDINKGNKQIAHGITYVLRPVDL